MFLFTQIIAKSWFKSLFSALIVLFLLLTVGDIINGFLRGNDFQIVIAEYLLKIPFLFEKVLPLCALLASVFSVNALKTHSELVAILAGGFDARKIYKIIFMFSLTITFAQFLNVSFIQPLSNKIKRTQFEKSAKNESKYLARSSIGNAGILWYKSESYFSSFSAFDRENKILKNLTIYYLSENQLIESIFEAKSAEYYENDLWNLKGLTITQNLANDKFPLRQKEDNLLISLNERPEDFSQFESDITTLSIFGLSQFIDRIKNSGINYAEYQVIFLEKISNSLICIIFALFPLIGIFKPNRRNSSFGKNIVLTLIFTILFWTVNSAIVSMGVAGKISPYLATMGIPIVFSLVIAVIYFKNRKLA